jgi:Uracil DNA glycosylase superfamily
MSEFDQALVSTFVEAGVLAQDRSPVHLPTACPRSGECWDGIRNREHEPGHPATEISAPWIGHRYADGRLLVVLENLRNFGGFDLRDDPPFEGGKGMRWLVKLARNDLAANRRRLFGKKGSAQGSTAVWTRAAEYAAVWLASVGMGPPVPAVGRVPSSVLADAFARFALTQHVKCSPRSNRSRPSAAMWQRCGAHVLQREIAVLRPTRVLIVGSSNNRRAFREHVLTGPSTQRRDQCVALGKRTGRLIHEVVESAHGRVEVLVVPHPATQGGTSAALLDAARGFLSGFIGVSD